MSSGSIWTGAGWHMHVSVSQPVCLSSKRIMRFYLVGNLLSHTTPLLKGRRLQYTNKSHEWLTFLWTRCSAWIVFVISFFSCIGEHRLLCCGMVHAKLPSVPGDQWPWKRSRKGLENAGVWWDGTPGYPGVAGKNQPGNQQMGDYCFHFYGEAQQNTLYLWNGADDIFPSKLTLKVFFSV